MNPNIMRNEDYKLDLSITPKELADLLDISVQGLHKFLKDKGIDTKVENTRFHKIAPRVVREIVLARGGSYPRTIIDLHNVKGGVGKSTCCHALASRAASYGAKVLMIDLDQQANLTASFGIYASPNSYPTLKDIHEGSFNGTPITAQDAVIELDEHLHLIPSNLALANLDAKISLDNTFNINTFFDDLIGELKPNYDFIFFDSPPALSRLTSSVHLFSDIVLMPVEPDKFSIDGLELNFANIENLSTRWKKQITTKIFLNKYDARPKIDYMIAGELAKTDYNRSLCETAVRYSSTLKSSIAEGVCVWNQPKSSTSLQDLNALLLEVSQLKKHINRNKEVNSLPKEANL